jgi:hexosaminidase
MSSGVRAIALFLLFGLASQAVSETRNFNSAEPAIIPRPMMVQKTDGEFQFKKTTTVGVASWPTDCAVSIWQREMDAVGQSLTGHLRRALGYEFSEKKINCGGVGCTSPEKEGGTDMGFLTMHGAGPSLGPEGYELFVKPDRIMIRATSSAGLFYGAQTLRQLVPIQEPSVENKTDAGIIIPCLYIVDRPRFQWRGFMLDSCRHYQSPEFIMQLLDVMAFYKLNRFHWHLTEDEAWRIELPRYPKLTEVGAWRGTGDKRYGGFYTREDIRRVLEHAWLLHILVIPEIETPGHSTVALIAYPEYACEGWKFEMGTDPLRCFYQKSGRQAFCAGKDETFKFLGNVINDVMDIFDSPYIHVGGDERPEGVWEKCPKCQSRLKELSLQNGSLLQDWFMGRVNRFVSDRGRRTIVWLPNKEAASPERQIVQAWHGDETEIIVQKLKRDCVQSDNGYCYFDYPSREEDRMPGQDWMSVLDVRKAYRWEPVPAGLTCEQAGRILGPEACLWTENVPQEKVYYKTFPRLLATCEVGWSPGEGKDYTEFYRRLMQHLPRLAQMGVSYNPYLPEP